ncbi:MAG: O-antigen ligase family protein [Bacteroidales bacterium]|nr:O-antigen ligase family protein [Bacteroidales bacterium]
MLLWFLNGMARMAAYRRFGNDYRPAVRRALLLLPVLFVLYVITMTYTANASEGWDTLAKKLPMLLVPCYFLIGKVDYLTTRRARAIGYFFTVSCALMGVSYIVYALWRMAFQGTGSSIFFYASQKLPHHTYSSMYFLFSLSFLYLEHRKYGSKMSRLQKVTMLICGIVLTIITLFVQSRSGLLCLLVLFLAALSDIVFARMRQRRGVALVVGAVLLASFTALFLVGGQNRLLKTAKMVSVDKHQDIRVEIWNNALQVIKKNPIFGVGVGDRFNELENNHERQFLVSPYYSWHPYNPHNQFLDAWLTAGLPGLLLTLALFVVPLVGALRAKPKRWLTLCFLFITGVSCLVESVLERQMGILFFVFAYSLLLTTQSKLERPRMSLQTSCSQSGIRVTSRGGNVLLQNVDFKMSYGKNLMNYPWRDNGFCARWHRGYSARL